MKKHRDADELAARLTAAANQPPVVVAFPVEAPSNSGVSSPPTHESASARTTPATETSRRKARKSRATRAVSEEPEDDTVPMSLRPRREILSRYVMAASERTRETGRVISAQQIMLEVLERGP